MSLDRNAVRVNSAIRSSTDFTDPAVLLLVIRHMELSFDTLTPLAFSHCGLFQTPRYILCISVEKKHKMLQPRFYIYKTRRNVDLGDNADDLVYDSSSADDIADIWSMFA